MTDLSNVLCLLSWHRKCLPNFNTQDYEYAADPSNGWTCPSCLVEIFPYNGIEDNYAFTQAIINPKHSAIDINILNTMVYDPFEANDNDNEGILNDIDPDQNFLNEIIGNSIKNCKYYHTSDQLGNLRSHRQEQSTSYLHLNIRSIPKNVDTFITTLHTSNMSMDILAFTETWLKTSNADCFGINGYTHQK
jgi:hypothetical protein